MFSISRCKRGILLFLAIEGHGSPDSLWHYIDVHHGRLFTDLRKVQFLPNARFHKQCSRSNRRTILFHRISVESFCQDNRLHGFYNIHFHRISIGRRKGNLGVHIGFHVRQRYRAHRLHNGNRIYMLIDYQQVHHILFCDLLWFQCLTAIGTNQMIVIIIGLSIISNLLIAGADLYSVRILYFGHTRRQPESLYPVATSFLVGYIHNLSHCQRCESDLIAILICHEFYSC